MKDKCDKIRNKLSAYLDGELSPEEIQAGLKKGIADRKIYPVFASSALTAAGVATFMDFAAEYFPSPADFGDVKGIDPDSEEEKTRPVSEGAPPVVFIFKTVSGIDKLILIFSGLFWSDIFKGRL